MSYQIDPDTDPIAACLLIFAERGAAIRAERERILATAQNDHEQIPGDGLRMPSPAPGQTNLDAIGLRDKHSAEIGHSSV